MHFKSNSLKTFLTINLIFPSQGLACSLSLHTKPDVRYEATANIPSLDLGRCINLIYVSYIPGRLSEAGFCWQRVKLPSIVEMVRRANHTQTPPSCLRSRAHHSCTVHSGARKTCKRRPNSNAIPIGYKLENYYLIKIRFMLFLAIINID